MSDIKGRKFHFGHSGLVLYTDSKYIPPAPPPPQLVSEGHQERWDTVLDHKLVVGTGECA